MKQINNSRTLAAALATAIAAPAWSIGAPTPDSGTIATAGDTIEFTGGPIGGANVSPTAGQPVCLGGGVECEVFTLTIAPPDGSLTTAQVTIGWSDSTNDLDIYLIDGDGNIAGSGATASNPEVINASGLAAGDYEVQILPFAAAEVEYTGLVEHKGKTSASAGSFPAVSTEGAPRVIVGVIDSAINPYHDFYYEGGPNYPDSAPDAVTPEVLAELGVKPENHITLTRTGDIQADIEADRAFWDSVERGELYWFVGTNVIAGSYAGAGVPMLVPTLEKSPHGVGTSSAVLKANPEAVIFFLETSGALANDDSHDATFLNPAVDIISTSYGVGVPVVGVPLPETVPFRNSFTAAVMMGKLHFSSAGNAPTFTPWRAGAGPWWSIGVSGNEEGTSEGRTSLSGNFPDFISDFTQELARCMDCESGLADYSGTSFSTPRAAGVASRVLLDARRKLGHSGGIRVKDGTAVMVERDDTPITNWFLRRALEQAAWLPPALDYDPESAVLDDLGAQPFNPAAPWLQTAWGDLSADPAKGVVEAALTHLDLAFRPRDKAVEFCDFQSTIIQERMIYWDELNGTAVEPSPFIWCESQLPTNPESNDPGGNFDAGGDADGDGIPNGDDNCPEDANTDQADADGDGFGDACDAPPPDSDGDGIVDSEDNCPVDGNADQQDTGGDGTGDACETPPRADAEPGPGRTLVASFDGIGGTVTTPGVCLSCGSGNDGFGTFEFRYDLPAGASYDNIEFVLSHETGTQYTIEIFGPSTDSLAFTGTDAFGGRVGDEPLSTGELAVVLDDPDTGLYLAQVKEEINAGNLAWTFDVYVTCPDTGCEAPKAAQDAGSRSLDTSAVAGGLGWLTLLSLMAGIVGRRRMHAMR